MISALVASLLVYSWKLIGYLIPEKYLTPKVKAFTERVTVALLAALVVTQTFASSQQLALDARFPAVLVAGVLLWLRAPFIVVVVAAAGVAAALRLLGL
jgi:branched-subunit amino acid transport protein